MADVLTHAGEEYLIKNGFDGATIDTGLYEDDTDALDKDSIDPAADLTTEPGGSNYARQTENPAADKDDNWLISYSVSFDTDDSTQDVDAIFSTINFDSVEGGSEDDWIVYAAFLSQTRDLSQIDQLDVNIEVIVT